ncbi:MAG: transposase [Blastocatellales bacterium]|nr:transposase [Blastocatellales bacterium]
MPKVFKNRLVLSKTAVGEGWHQRGYFPHFDGGKVTQHVCIHLADSLPRTVLESWRERVRHLEKSTADAEIRSRIQSYLDAGYGNCWLREDRAAEIIRDSLLHFNARQYRLHAWCVMPNHVHVLVTPLAGHVLSKIVGDWKRVTAHKCCRLLGIAGPFWHKEYYDRYIRNARHFQNAMVYIENNPVKAGLCPTPEEWKWSSARR